jgi:hypothetical protein
MLAKNGEQMTTKEKYNIWINWREKLHWLPGAIAALALRRPSWFTVVGFVTFRRIVEFLNVYASRGSVLKPF